jgi:hypothetical protein
MMIPLKLNSKSTPWGETEKRTAKWRIVDEIKLSTHPFSLFSLSPDKDYYFFLALQLFVRISIHLSSPGIKSSPQECGEGPLDKE